jgi:hypothetical protein
MRALTAASVALVLVAAAACGTPAQDPDMQPLSAKDAPSAVAIGAIQTRDHKVTFLTGDRLKVEDARGVVLADGVTLEGLQKVDPFLYAACVNATARSGTYVDARLDRLPAPHDDRAE